MRSWGEAEANGGGMEETSSAVTLRILDSHKTTPSIASSENNTSSNINSLNNENTKSTAETPKTRVDWTAYLPRELRDKIYNCLLPPVILVRRGIFDATELVGLLRINSRSSKEIRELMRKHHHCIFEFLSTTALLTALNSVPAIHLAPYNKLTLRVDGPYNGHSNIYGNNNGWHRTNICPNLHRDGDVVWFEIFYTCLDCEGEPFAQRELNYARATLLGKFERLTGMQLPRRVETRVYGWSNAHLLINFRAYRKSVSKHS